jgi:hypothetical protein
MATESEFVEPRPPEARRLLSGDQVATDAEELITPNVKNVRRSRY